MKIRTGFVSNSSSSSFVLRGVKMKISALAKIFNEDTAQDNLFDKLYDHFGYSGAVKLESTRQYFDGEDCNTADVIVGVKLITLEDGEVTELKDPNDVKTKEKIEKKIGKVSKLKTYIQYVSNDNY